MAKDPLPKRPPFVLPLPRGVEVMADTSEKPTVPNSPQQHPQGQEVPLQLGLDEIRSAVTNVELAAANKDGPITRDTIIERARRWAAHPVPYSMNEYKDGYRTDCSGYVSMAWNLSISRTTWTLVDICRRTPISKDDLLPGDVLIKNNPIDPQNGSHVVIFAGWANAGHTHYQAYEQTPPQTRYDASMPYPYSGDPDYRPYRYDNVIDDVAIPKTANTAGWLMLLTDAAVS